MPRVPRISSDAQRGRSQIPFAPQQPIDLSPVAKLGEQLTEVGRKAKIAEQTTALERSKIIAKRLANQELLEIQQLRDEDEIQKRLADTSKNIASGIATTVSGFPTELRQDAEAAAANLLSSFNLKGNQHLVEMRLSRARANIEDAETDALRLAENARTDGERAEIISDFTRVVERAGATNAIDIEQERERINEVTGKIRSTSFTASARERARSQPNIFIIEADNGTLEAEGFPADTISDGRTIASRIIERRESRADKVDKAINEHTMEFFAQSARTGDFDGEMRDRAVIALNSGAIDDADLEKLERLNTIRSNIAPSRSDIASIIGRVYENPSLSTIRNAQSELDELVLSGFDRNADVILRGRRQLFNIEQRFEGINNAEAGRAIRRLRLAIKSKVSLAGGNIFTAIEAAMTNRMFEEVLLADDPMATADKLADQINREPGIIGLDILGDDPGKPKSPEEEVQELIDAIKKRNSEEE